MDTKDKNKINHLKNHQITRKTVREKDRDKKSVKQTGNNEMAIVNPTYQ